MPQIEAEKLDRVQEAYQNKLVELAQAKTCKFLDGDIHAQPVHQLATKYWESDLMRTERALIESGELSRFIKPRMQAADTILRMTLGRGLEDEMPKDAMFVMQPESKKTLPDLSGVVTFPFRRKAGSAWVSIVGYFMHEPTEDPSVNQVKKNNDHQPVVFPSVHLVDGFEHIDHGWQARRYFPYQGQETYLGEDEAPWQRAADSVIGSFSIGTAVVAATDMYIGT